MHKFAKTFLLASLAYQAQPIKLLEYIDPSSLQNMQTNTMVILNEDIDLYLKLQFKANKCYLKETQGLEDFDIIAINKYGILPFSIKTDQDQLRLRKYFLPLEPVTSKDDAIKQLANKWTSLIISYIPEDRLDLEQQYQNINYRDINNNAQYLIIRDSEVAQQFNLGKNDIGEIYVLKQSSIVTNNESSFQHNGREYNFTKVDADPNTENADELRHKVLERNLIAELGDKLGIDLFKSTYSSTKPYQIDKVLQRIGLHSQGYINVVENIQEMEDILQLIQLHSINYIVIYTNAHQSQEIKHLKKLIKFKKSLPIAQQEQMMVIQLKSPALQRKYFGLIESGILLKYQFQLDIESQIRFIDLQNRQKDIEGEKQYVFHQLQYQENRQQQYQNNIRYLFDAKITANRLLQYFNNLKEQYYEYTDGQQPTKFFTKTAQDTLPDEYLLLYYKRNCQQCKDLSKSLEKVEINLPLIRINILNESLLPCPSRAPQILIKKNGQIIHAQLEKKNIAATDVQALQYYLNRL